MTVTIGYTTDDDYIAFALARGVTVTVLEAAIELTKALDYMETLTWQGSRTEIDQPLSWPRSDVVVDCIAVAADVVPAGVIKSQHVIALAIHAGYDPLGTIERAVRREKVDVIEIEYMDNASATAAIRSISATIRPYLVGGGCVGGPTSVYRVL